jgi:hypothetical protein
MFLSGDIFANSLTKSITVRSALRRCLPERLRSTITQCEHLPPNEEAVDESASLAHLQQ